MPITPNELRTLLEKKRSIVLTYEEGFLDLLSTTKVGEKFLADPENNAETLDRLPGAEFGKRMIRLNAELFLAKSEFKKPDLQAVFDAPIEPQNPDEHLHQPLQYQFFLQQAEGRKRLIKHTLDRVSAIEAFSIPHELKERLLGYVKEKAELLYDHCIESQNCLGYDIVVFPDEQRLTTYFDQIIATFLEQEDNRVAEQTFMEEEDKYSTIQRDQETTKTESIFMDQEDTCATFLRNQERDQTQRLQKEKAKQCAQEIKKNLQTTAMDQLIVDIKNELLAYQQHLKKTHPKMFASKSTNAYPYKKWEAAQKLQEALERPTPAAAYKAYNEELGAQQTWMITVKGKPATKIMTTKEILSAHKDSWGRKFANRITFGLVKLKPHYGEALVRITDQFFNSAKQQKKQETTNIPKDKSPIPAFRGPSSSPAA